MHSFTAASRQLGTSGEGDVSYSIEYQDAGRHHITEQPWPRLFNISDARQHNRATNNSPFVVTTVLDTSILPNTIRTSVETRHSFQDRILENPDVALSVQGMKVTIYSQVIIQALREVVTYYPCTNLRSSKLEILEPFCIIAHHISELESYNATCRDSETSWTTGERNPDSTLGLGASTLMLEATPDTSASTDGTTPGHIRLLLDFFKKACPVEIIDREKNLYAMEPPLCTFRMLWLAFKPGTTVYVKSEGRIAARVVQSVDVDSGILSNPAREPSAYVLRLWYLDFDGYKVGRRCCSETIHPFESESEIMSLNVFPCAFLDKMDDGKNRRELEAYGRKWFSFLKGGRANYLGPSLQSQEPLFRGPVVVDCLGYWESKDRTPGESGEDKPVVGEVGDFGGLQSLRERRFPFPTPPVPGCSCNHCNIQIAPGETSFSPKDFPWRDYDDIDPIVTETLETSAKDPATRNHRYLLCSRVLGGFVLSTKTWEKLDVACCTVMKSSTSVLDHLLIPAETKKMIIALIRSLPEYRWRDRLRLNDLIEGTAAGRVLLLHGPPGVGKTSVKCIADAAERPLLSLICRDIGTEDLAVEENLAKWFRLARRWDAVVLIHEAEIYLEKRMITDYNGNRLVRAFYRSMDDFRGLLMLSANRLGRFDDAVISRIHMVIPYENLGLVEARRIWKMWLERDVINVSLEATRYVLENEDMVAIKWNGREIRNAFLMAVALAKYRCSDQQLELRLELEDFKSVFEMMRQFKDSLKIRFEYAAEEAHNHPS